LSPGGLEARPASALADRLPSRWRRRGALSAGGAILIVFGMVILFAHVIAPIDPQAIATRVRLRPPSAEYWFGTDRLGRDIFSRTVFGTSASLAVGLAVACLSAALGLALGLIAGAVRGVDGIIMRCLDAIMAVPGILIAIAAISVAGPSIATVVLALGINEMPRVARLVRSLVLSLREEPFVEAAFVLGSPRWRIILDHMLPGVIAPLAVLTTHIAASAMLLEATLSFLGCGLPPDVPTWGNIMADGRILFRVAPWIILFPGLTLSTAVLAINLFGDGLRDLLDPRASVHEV
jgi:peptide/nickel transport system permease protein